MPTDNNNIFLDLPQSLRLPVTQKFNEAQSSRELIFSQTELTTLTTSNKVVFQLRYCPALARKPTDNKSKPKPKDDGVSKLKFNPFADPSPSLLVTAVPSSKPTHNIILNKFPIIANHFILATTAEKLQTDLLEADDLFVSYQCVRAWSENHEDGRKRALYGFFNSGPFSGASQPHRHLQFLPIEDMANQPLVPSSSKERNDTENAEWEVLTETMSIPCQGRLPLLCTPKLPFRHFAVRLDESITSERLHQLYIMLLKVAYLTTTNDINSLPDTDLNDVQVTREGSQEVVFSYNLSLTLNSMAIFPRRSDEANLPGLGDGESSISINGTILAGTLMVKSEKEWDTLREKPELLDNLLRQIGFPNENTTKKW